MAERKPVVWVYNETGAEVHMDSDGKPFNVLLKRWTPIYDSKLVKRFEDGMGYVVTTDAPKE